MTKETKEIEEDKDCYESKTPSIKTSCGDLYLTLAYRKDGVVKRVLATLGKCGGCPASFLDPMSYLIKLCIRYGVPKEKIILGLKGSRCNQPLYVGKEVLSCSDALGKLIEIYYEEPEAKK